MLTVYFNAKEKDRTLILETNHKPLVSLQIIDPIKRSKEPIPVDLIQFKASGDAYDIYRLLFELGKRKAKINFTY